MTGARFGAFALEIPLDNSLQRHKAVLDQDLDPVVGDDHVDLHGVHNIAGDFGVGPNTRRRDLDIVGHRPDTIDALRRLLSREFIGVAVNEAGQGHDILLSCDVDVARHHLRIPLELAYDILPQLAVAFFLSFRLHRIFLLPESVHADHRTTETAKSMG